MLAPTLVVTCDVTDLDGVGAHSSSVTAMPLKVAVTPVTLASDREAQEPAPDDVDTLSRDKENRSTIGVPDGNVGLWMASRSPHPTTIDPEPFAGKKPSLVA